MQLIESKHFSFNVNDIELKIITALVIYSSCNLCSSRLGACEFAAIFTQLEVRYSKNSVASLPKCKIKCQSKIVCSEELHCKYIVFPVRPMVSALSLLVRLCLTIIFTPESRNP